MSSAPLPIDDHVIVKKIRAFKVQQPIGDIYCAAVDHKLIQQITFFDVRRRIQAERDVERYLGVQRELSASRVRDLVRYVNFIDATFPTSIILAVDSDYATYDDKRLELSLSNAVRGSNKPSIAFRGLCRVLDGQHRIAGLAGFEGDRFDVMVSLFIGSDIADQAHVFATVNLEQTKVGKSLAIDLFELARTRSPIKTCHNIAVALDNDKNSPFYKRIKRLGVATEGRATGDGPGEKLTQATFVNALVRYISDDPKEDRDRLLRGETIPFVEGKDDERLCFRNMFIREKDVQIGKIVESYFEAVRQRWPAAWDAAGKGLMLNQSNGFRALMRLLGESYNYVARPGQLVDVKKFTELFARVKVKSDYFTIERFKPGSSGEAALRQFLRYEIFGEE